MALQRLLMSPKLSMLNEFRRRNFLRFFFANPKTFPIFAVLNIYCQAGDVRQLLAGFFYARTISNNIIPVLGSLIGSVPRRRLMALQPGKVFSSGERNLFCFRIV